MILKALIESFQNQVSLLDLVQVVKNAVDSQSFTTTEVRYTMYVLPTLFAVADASPTDACCYPFVFRSSTLCMRRTLNLLRIAA